MRRETYQRGVPGAKWGIWNCSRKEFQFDICEDTPTASRMTAQPWTPQLCSWPHPQQARLPVSTFSRCRAFMSS